MSESVLTIGTDQELDELLACLCALKNIKVKKL